MASTITVTLTIKYRDHGTINTEITETTESRALGSDDRSKPVESLWSLSALCCT